MKKSESIWNAFCKITDGEYEFICHALKGRKDICTDIQEVIDLLGALHAGWKCSLFYQYNNFYSAAPNEWKDEDEFQELRAMYCLFLYWDYLEQGD